MGTKRRKDRIIGPVARAEGWIKRKARGRCWRGVSRHITLLQHTRTPSVIHSPYTYRETVGRLNEELCMHCIGTFRVETEDRNAYKYTRTNPRNFLRCVCARMHRAHQGPRERRTRRILSLSAARSTWEKHWLTCRRRFSQYSLVHGTPGYSCIFTGYTAITKLFTLSHGVLTIVSRSGV